MGDTGTLIVTGGTGGIGKAIVRDAIARGYSICFSFALDGEAASQLIDEMKREGGHVIGVRCDVTNETDIANLFHRAGAELGPVNGLVNNAGITGPIGPFATASMTTIRNVVDVNLMGTMLCTQHAVKTWQASGMAGTVVNISSIAATLGAPGEYVHYAASKAAVEAFTIGLGKELGPSGIRVNAVSPGTILTDIHAKAGEPGRTDRIAPNVPLRRVGQPEEIARAVPSLVKALYLRASRGKNASICWRPIRFALRRAAANLFQTTKPRGKRMRIKLIDRADMDSEQARVFDAAKDGGGVTGGPYYAYIRIPKIFETSQNLRFALFSGPLSGRERQIANLVVARHWDAEYPWAAQVRGSLAVGLEQSVIDAINARKTPDLPNARERACYDVSRELLATKRIGASTYASAEKALGLTDLIALVATTGSFSMTCMTANSFEVDAPADAPTPLAK